MPGFREYYFRKLIRFLQSREYHRAKDLRAQTNPQISIPEVLYLRWGIRTYRPQVLVEIGSFCGASTVLMADQLRELGEGRIYAIDFFSQSSSSSGYSSQYHKTFDETMAPYLGWFEKIEGDSKKVPWNQPINFLFIDGDHSAGGVQADITKYTPFLRPGGCVFLHDYVDVPEDNSMVKSAVDQTLLKNPVYRNLGVVRSLIAFEKLPPSTPQHD